MHAERKLHIKHLVWKKSNNEAPERDGQADDPCPTRTIALLNNHQHIRICYKKKQQRAASSEWDKSMYISLSSFFFACSLLVVCKGPEPSALKLISKANRKQISRYLSWSRGSDINRLEMDANCQKRWTIYAEKPNGLRSLFTAWSRAATIALVCICNESEKSLVATMQRGLITYANTGVSEGNGALVKAIDIKTGLFITESELETS